MLLASSKGLTLQYDLVWGLICIQMFVHNVTLKIIFKYYIYINLLFYVMVSFIDTLKKIKILEK
jgi:hypothetical protein